MHRFLLTTPIPFFSCFSKNTTNHLDTQTINLRVSFRLFYFSHLPHLGSHVTLSRVPSCPCHYHCLHSGCAIVSVVPKSQRAVPVPLQIPVLQNLMTHLFVFSFPFHLFEFSRLIAFWHFSLTHIPGFLFIILARPLPLTWHVPLNSIFVEGLE